jgi:hypothetical protein
MSIAEFRPAATQPGLSENDRIAHDMTVVVRRPLLSDEHAKTKPPLPVRPPRPHPHQALIFDAGLAATTELAELFGDEFTRALHRETTYQVPDSERQTCPTHLDWRSHCLPLHVKAA